MSASRKIEIFESLNQLIQASADFVFEVAQTAVGRKSRFNIVLSGGNTPIPLYERLARTPYLEEMPWSATHFYWSDERIVPPDHSGSNYGQAKHLLLDRIQARPENVHRIKGELTSVEATADYSAQLNTLSRSVHGKTLFDVVLLGLGSDGHTASLFPGSSDKVSGELSEAIMADYGGRPAHRVTLTPEAINRARYVVFLVSGADKAMAVMQSIAGGLDPLRWPAHRINPISGEIIWMLDDEAGALLSAS